MTKHDGYDSFRKNCLTNSGQGQMIGMDTIPLLHQKQAHYLFCWKILPSVRCGDIRRLHIFPISGNRATHFRIFILPVVKVKMSPVFFIPLHTKKRIFIPLTDFFLVLILGRKGT
ncbi:MAG: hypothetical protein C4522_12390 [Desulfobacteraceae bacterium]|nr:MAG: hypothetical protein C4522_12390 [Desulfobacteraceae bacterium]